MSLGKREIAVLDLSAVKKGGLDDVWFRIRRLISPRTFLRLNIELVSLPADVDRILFYAISKLDHVLEPMVDQSPYAAYRLAPP